LVTFELPVQNTKFSYTLRVLVLKISDIKRGMEREGLEGIKAKDVELQEKEEGGRG
jgi:hypothetical protein